MEIARTDNLPDPNQGVEDTDNNTHPLLDPDGETGREDGGDEDGPEGMRNLS